MRDRKPRRSGGANRFFDTPLKKIIVILSAILAVLLIVFAVKLIKTKVTSNQTGTTTEGTATKEETPEEVAARVEEEKKKAEEEAAQKKELIASTIEEANRLAASYDYVKAANLIKAIDGYAEDADCVAAIKSYRKAKKKCVRYDKMNEITHIFFHALTIDTEKSFDGDDMADKYNMVMTTEKEFREILNQMYEKGYVLIRIHDMVKEVKDKDGNVTFEQGDIYLPKGKTPFVLSEDDVCYYEYMDGDGYAKRIVIGEDGKPTCEKVMDDGSIATGEYDIVPILDAFVEEHPDFSYRGAKGILALTGYNGILGYRTDTEYKDNPTFKEDRKMAKKVAQALRDDGWEFASHSWGHRDYGEISMADLKEDAEKWEKRVEPLIGDTDILIYPFGADIGSWYPYEGERFEYLKSLGFDYFCNVDSAQYWVQYGDNYLRQGRRNIDGQRLYADLALGADKLSDILDVKKVFDKARPVPVPQ